MDSTTKLRRPANDAMVEASVMVRALRGLLDARLIETHISWVLLSGAYAYKIKKPVNLGFLDFSTLERRKHFCEEELRLNRRFAADLYVAVVAITGRPSQPSLDSAGEPIDYAVKMRRFDPDQSFDSLLAHQALAPSMLDQLARTLAQLHERSEPAAPNSAFGTPASVIGRVDESLGLMRSLAAELAETSAMASDLAGLGSWLTEQTGWVEVQTQARKARGFVRECHGDLHLANIVLVDGVATPFDCLEFDADLRCIDVISDVAFVMMDLIARQRPDLAYRFLNAYLEQSGDYEGLVMLRYYIIYRALVRGKVALLRARQVALDEVESARQIQLARLHVALALAQSQTGKPSLTICFGLSGSGKTAVSQCLLELLPAIRLRSDVERKRLAGLPALAASGSPVGAGLYETSANERTYRRLAELSAQVLDAGFSVIVDASFLKRAQRTEFGQLAKRKSVPFTILEVEADEPSLRRRIALRLAANSDASEANLAVLANQLARRDTLTAAERSNRLIIENSVDRDAEALTALCRPIARQIGQRALEQLQPSSRGARTTPNRNG